MEFLVSRMEIYASINFAIFSVGVRFFACDSFLVPVFFGFDAFFGLRCFFGCDVCFGSDVFVFFLYEMHVPYRKYGFTYFQYIYIYMYIYNFYFQYFFIATIF